jgi:plastocyanin
MRIARFTPIAALSLVLLLVVALSAGCSSGGTTGGGGSTAPSGGTSTGGGTTPAAGGAVVVMKNIAFDNASPTMKAGESITFKNEDSAPHNIKIDNKESGIIDPGKSWSVSIAKAGAYPFACIIHPTMTGSLTVQ